MGHYLKANKSSRTPSTFIFFDTETWKSPVDGKVDRTIHRFKLGYGCSFRLEGTKQTRRKCIQFTEISKFWEWVISHLSKHRPVWMFAHNVAFDLTTTLAWQLMEEGIFEVQRYVSDDPPTVVKLSSKSGTLVVLDSLNWFRSTLEAIGKSVGMPKIDVDFDSCTDSELMEHCKQDVRILERRIYTLLIWLKENDLGVMQKTGPSQALQCYRHRFAPSTTVVRQRKQRDGSYKEERIKVCYPLMHDSPAIATAERRAYFGGEARCFWVGKIHDPDSLGTVAGIRRNGKINGGIIGPVYHLDVNALFPYVMKEYKYPCKFLYSLECPQLSVIRKALEDGEVIATVRLYSPLQTFPIRVIDKPSYVCGKFWTSLCGNELRYALQCGFVKSIAEAHIYEVRDMFSSFVDFFWKLRQEYKQKGDSCNESLCKLMMNSLYGKFGARAYKWIDSPHIPAAMPWGQWVADYGNIGQRFIYRSIAWHTQEKQESGEAKDSFVSIPAVVCANARQYMRELRAIAGDRQVLYQHTDSLHVTLQGYVALERNGRIASDRIGLLKLVEEVNHGEYRGINNISVNGRDIIAGINTRNGRNPEGNYDQDKFANLTSITSARPPDGVIVKRSEYSIPRLNPGDTVDASGWVYPQRLG